MSMTPPFNAEAPDDGIAAADPGAAAPPPAPGFGIGDGDPDAIAPENLPPEESQRADRPSGKP